MKIKLLQTKVYVNNRRRRQQDRLIDTQMRLEVSQAGRAGRLAKVY